MSATSDDRKVIQCNLSVTMSYAVEGARAYVVRLNPGWGNERIVVLVRSRGGRWIEKWESVTRLRDFRVKTIPEDHPRYSDTRLLPAGCVSSLDRARLGMVENGE